VTLNESQWTNNELKIHVLFVQIVAAFKELVVSALAEGSLDLPVNSEIDGLLASKVPELSLATLATADLGEA